MNTVIIEQVGRKTIKQCFSVLWEETIKQALDYNQARKSPAESFAQYVSQS